MDLMSSQLVMMNYKITAEKHKVRFTYTGHDENYHKGLSEAHTEQRNSS